MLYILKSFHCVFVCVWEHNFLFVRQTTTTKKQHTKRKHNKITNSDTTCTFLLIFFLHFVELHSCDFCDSSLYYRTKQDEQKSCLCLINIQIFCTLHFVFAATCVSFLARAESKKRVRKRAIVRSKKSMLFFIV